MGSDDSSDLCGSCKEQLAKTKLSIGCDKCETWFHDTCAGLSNDEIKIIVSSSEVLWFCGECKSDIKNSSVSTTSSVNTIINQDDQNSDNWRKLDTILRTLAINNERFTQIEERLESNAVACSDKHEEQSNMINDINTKLDENVLSLRDEMAMLREEAQAKQNSTASTCGSCVRLEERVENIERTSFQHDLVLEGLPQMLSNNKARENLLEAVHAISTFYNVGLNSADIFYCYRAGREVKGRGPRPVIIGFKLKSARDALYYAYMKKRDLKLKDIVTSSEIASRIYITERITAACKQLLRRCAALKKSNVIAKYYTRNGRLFIEKGLNSGAELATACLVDSLER